MEQKSGHSVARLVFLCMVSGGQHQDFDRAVFMIRGSEVESCFKACSGHCQNLVLSHVSTGPLQLKASNSKLSPAHASDISDFSAMSLCL